jgi:hypothetical protein
VNVNAIAQNFVENPDYFPPEVMSDDGMRRAEMPPAACVRALWGMEMRRR